jgi:Tfp pilus assembly protein PilO
MTRIQVLLATLAAVLLVVLFYFLVLQPKQEELETLESDIEATIARQQQLTTERNRLRGVREAVPEIEAEIRTARTIVPSDPALPSTLRQVQVAADDAGIVLRVVSVDRAEPLDEAPEGLSSLGLSLQLEGSYFQIVDFLRRIEDPSITPRGVRWDTLTISRDEYPTLLVNVSGRVFAALPVAPPEDAPEPAPTDDNGDDVEDDADADTEDDLPDLEDET